MKVIEKWNGVKWVEIGDGAYALDPGMYVIRVRIIERDK